MSVDLGGLPKLPDPDTIITDAGLIAASGARAAENGTSLVTTWNRVQAVYSAPEESLVYEAMRPVTEFTNEASIVASLIQAALDTFAEAVRAMESRHKDLVTAAGTSYPESTDEDPDYGKNKEAEVTAGISALAQEYADAEEACASAIRLADPSMAEEPGFTESPGYQIVTEAADQILTDARRTRIVVSTTVPVPRLQVSTVFVSFADGRIVPQTRRTLGMTTVQVHRSIPTITMNPNASALPELPTAAKGLGKALGVAGIGLSIYGNISEQWNQDLIDHPEYDNAARVKSAAVNVAWESGLSALGGLGGALGGAAIGTAICPGIGTVIGGVAGSILGGAGGEWVGSLGKGLVADGKSLGDAAYDASKEFLDSLWMGHLLK
ncbi:hypothetical protein [Arthrobacter sp. zg-Y769]|uniref:hypothetical protein n=1 Tax=Arthrobacter sp. zg-Y769 TaxID=2894191 RepID=UPI001E5F8B5A|nr:hypothetical protein [Arthrobacter sp. zg-Y769]MCC9206325.1 hypothetical protein [Arthrobacter sp. zg-Y769]